jgi:glycosyltransferase involved in cell wall biosynthesis
LHRLAADLGLQEHLTFLGYVEPVEPVFHAWDLCVSTSEYETFGMSVLEAMACECPVIAYPGGSVAEIVGDAACVVPQGDEDALYSETLRLVKNPDLLNALGKQGRQHAKSTYDIRPAVEMLVNEYRQVVNSAR